MSIISPNIRKNFRQVAFPIFIETFLMMLLGAMDTLMLSQYSDDKVASVGMANQLLNMILLIYTVTTIGTSVCCSQFFGAGERRSVMQILGVSVLFNTIAGGIVSLGLYFFSYNLLNFMQLDQSLMDDAVNYMQIVGGFSFIQALSLTLSAFLRSAGKAFYPMYVTVLINVLNIFGNYTLIFGKFGFPEMGVMGAAISTCMSRLVALLILIFIVFRVEMKDFTIKCLSPFPYTKLKNMLSIGLPAAGENFSYCASQVTITYFINMLGTEALTARTYVVNIVMFSYLLASATGMGGGICIGHLVGYGKKNAAYILGFYCIKLAVISSLVASVATAIFGRNIMALLTQNPQIIRMGAYLLIIDVGVEIGRAVNMFAVNGLRATGDARYPFWVGVVFMWGVATALGYVFGITFEFGILGMWVAFLLDENMRAVVFVRRWMSKKWASKGFIQHNDTVKKPSDALSVKAEKISV
ncbi:MAG: MATE family efflux transporter [Flavobacteriales bacterium]|nr:MATE family efflux transporter [Flavobacteriales bacterium]